jgi:putative transcription factor
LTHYLQAIQDARLALKFSQKDLAEKINEKTSVIQDYESGKAIPNPQILGKLERHLGVKLRGKINPLDHSKAALNDEPNRF